MAQVNVYSKKYNKFYSTNAAKLTSALYLSEMGVKVTPHTIKREMIVFVFSIKGEDGTTIGATMLSKRWHYPYRVMGLAVVDKRKGYGTALMQALCDSVPKSSIIELGVDKHKETTEWLLKWYQKLGFKIVLEKRDEILLHMTTAA